MQSFKLNYLHFFMNFSVCFSCYLEHSPEESPILCRYTLHKAHKVTQDEIKLLTKNELLVGNSETN